MQAFEYANPATLQDALALLGAKWGEADVLAGGTDLLGLMKDYVHTPKRVVNIKGIKELGGIQKTAAGFRIGATVTVDELASNAEIRKLYPVAPHGGGQHHQPADPQHGDGGRRPLPAPALLVLPPGLRPAGQARTASAGARRARTGTTPSSATPGRRISSAPPASARR